VRSRQPFFEDAEFGFRATGVQPKMLERLRISGIQLPPRIFEEVIPVNL